MERNYIFIGNKKTTKALKRQIIDYLDSRKVDELPTGINHLSHHQVWCYKIAHNPGKHPETGELVENIILTETDNYNLRRLI